MRLLLLAYPWLELLSLIQLGINTNALVALSYVLLMLFVGIGLLRFVGVTAFQRLRDAQQTGRLQQHLLVDDLAVAVAALLLMIPGLLSDFFALVVLIGPLRRGLARALGLTATNESVFSNTDGAFHNSSQHAFRDPQQDPPQALFQDPSHETVRDRSAGSERPVTLDGEFEEVDQRDRQH
jgi:UPF0716 protein FxsA